MARRGRPSLPESERRHTVKVTVRATREERKAWTAAAEAIGSTVAEEMRAAMVALVAAAEEEG